MHLIKRSFKNRYNIPQKGKNVNKGLKTGFL